MPDFASVKAGLENRLGELTVRAGHIKADLEHPPTADWEEQATETEEDEALEGQGRLIVTEIRAVKSALSRIETGSYGECVSCGEDIAPPRLEAFPEAALCINCARIAEGC